MLALTGCGGTAGSDTPAGQGSSDPGTVQADPSALAQLGEKIFHDECLSASGRMSCATCHDPDHAFAQPTDSGVSFGGPGLDQPGVRNAPSLKYAARTPQFFFAADGTPTGGFNRDGRALDLADQAVRPFIASFEMANASAADVVDKLSRATYADEFRAQFGQQIAPYFHNGRFQTLQDVVGFYVRRDTNPEEWYPIGPDGLVRKFNDLPPQYAKNVNTEEVPYNRHPGDQPALTPAEIDDVVAFLQTLTDGYQP